MVGNENINGNAGLFFDLGAQSRPSIISLVGSGGKTSTIFWLAQLFHASGRRVVVTTTMQMYMLDAAYPVIFCREPATLPSYYLSLPILTCFHSWKAQEGKARSFSARAIDALAARAECDVILVEADGAHGLPLKAPDEYEPCIPESSCCVIAVTGGHMLGRKTGAKNVHRWPLFADITGLTADESLTFEHLLRLIRHPKGAFKNVPSGSRRIWFLNQFYQYENSVAEGDLNQLLRNGDVDAIWLGAILERPPIMRRFVK